MNNTRFTEDAKEQMTNIAEDSISKISSVGTQMLIALARNQYKAYAGTVSKTEKKRRRKANKAARKARKVNRGL